MVVGLDPWLDGQDVTNQHRDQRLDVVAAMVRLFDRE